MEPLRIKKLKPNAILPKRATPGSAGMDLCACLEAPIRLHPGERALIPTGIAIALPSPSYVAMVYARSGLAVKYGLNLSNSVGVIDSDYRGEVQVALLHQGQEAFTIEPGMRVAQLVILPVSLLPVEESLALDDTQRGEGGFGSTGVK